MSLVLELLTLALFQARLTNYLNIISLNMLLVYIDIIYKNSTILLWSAVVLMVWSSKSVNIKYLIMCFVIKIIVSSEFNNEVKVSTNKNKYLIQNACPNWFSLGLKEKKRLEQIWHYISFSLFFYQLLELILYV